MREQIIRKLLSYFALDFHINNVSNNFLINLMGFYLHENYPNPTEIFTSELSGVEMKSYTNVGEVPVEEMSNRPLFGTWIGRRNWELRDKPDVPNPEDSVPRITEWWEPARWYPGKYYNADGEYVTLSYLELTTLPLFTSLVLGISPTLQQLEEDATFMGLDPFRVMELPEESPTHILIKAVAELQKNSGDITRHPTGYILPVDLNQRIVEQGGLISVYQYPKF